MREAEVARILRQRFGELAIAEPGVAFLSSPGTEMDLVDRHRRRQRIDVCRRRKRFRQRALIEHDRCPVGANLACEGQRIGLERQRVPIARRDCKLVAVARPRARYEQFPVAVAAHPHQVTLGVPEIEIAYEGDRLRVGREQDEADPRDALAGHRMRAELVIEALMRAFAEQIEIEVAQDRRKAVRVLELDGVVAEARAQPVMARVVGDFA